MQIFTCILLGFLVVCAISVSLSKNLLNSILIYMSFSLIMSIIWVLLNLRIWLSRKPQSVRVSPASCSL